MLKLGIAFLQVASMVFSHLEKQRLISEGERRQIAKELAAVASSAAASKKVREEVERLSDAEVDDRLAGDFRD